MEFLQDLVLALIYVVLISVPCALAVCIYRLSYHPLRGYPGPLIARLSDFYGAYYAAKTTLHLKTYQDHKRYGSVIRHGPNKLVFCSINALYDIYQNDRITKSRAYLVSQRAPGAYGLFNSIDRHMHQRKRKLLGPVLNERSTRAFEDAMSDQIDIFIQGLASSFEKQPPTPVNMTDRLMYLAMDIMGQFVFDYPLNLQTSLEYRSMADTTANYFLNVALQLPFLSKARISSFRHIRALLRGKSYRETLKKMIRNRLSQGSNAKHNLFFMTDTLRLSDDDETFIEEIRSEATFLISAGSDTISTCLSALFFYLSRYPECYRRLTTEIRSTFKNSSEIRSGPRLASCTYMRACIDESMRISPPIAGTLWRQQVADGDGATGALVIDGHVIPRGTHVGVNIYALHHNEEYFPDPFTFRPERFLHGDLHDGKSMREAYAPFSVGSRGCMGKSMAYLEASLILAKTIWHFDFLQAPGEEGRLGESTYWELRGEEEKAREYQTYDIFGAAHDGPCLIFRPRVGGVTECI